MERTMNNIKEKMSVSSWECRQLPGNRCRDLGAACRTARGTHTGTSREGEEVAREEGPVRLEESQGGETVEGSC